MMKTAIVLGATGLIGKHVIAQLIQCDDIEKIIAITRRPIDFGNKKVVSAQVCFDQLTDYSDVFKGDLLFSCLGTTKKQAGSISMQRTVDFDYQLQAAQIAARNKVPHYFLVSSSGANAQSRNPYLKMKGQLEDEISKLGFAKICIVQPSLLLGKRDHFRLAETLGACILPIVCKIPGLHKFRPIFGEQVAIKMVKISQSQTYGKKTFKLDELF
ncbi:NADH dehydrogenase [Pseudoalteromonas luteoviolacea]|uniref:NADH dehydrogenase n=1 Tax=Pseudoalteromonas luteoviolacea TaxID=43657 RepID=A0A1C0TXU2_9GAMM|nr:NAD(P)H-binding protein [Pseudoalteromonas luteoviolacea]OCQ24064.1 NADH dehydrogenase [Pseudoalteromonas luteoviolacea]